MAKRGRIMTPVELIKPTQCIEIDNQFIFRVSEIERVVVMGGGVAPTETRGLMLMGYRRQVQFFFPDNSLVDLVDESTLTHVPFD